MGNSLIGAYDKQFNRNAVVKWTEPENVKYEEDAVAKPLRAPYAPAELKSQNPLFVQDIFPSRNGSYLSMHTISLTPRNNEQRNRFIQTHNLFHTVDKSDDLLCPVSITSTRHLEPVRVGAGVVLTKVVQVLEDYPVVCNDTISFVSPTPSNKDNVPRTPLPSPDVVSKPFGNPIPLEDNSEDDLRAPPNSANQKSVQLFKRVQQ